MTTVWNVETFFDRFEKGTLGRKSQYSTYWVNDFDGCKILCNKVSGRRGGEVPMGIFMGPELCVFNKSMASNTYSPQFSMGFPRDEDVTESGLIDSEVSAGNPNARSVLFQLGHGQYLLEPYWTHSAMFDYEFIQNAPYDKTVDILQGVRYTTAVTKAPPTAVIKALPGGMKYSSVKEARAALIPQAVLNAEADSFQIKNWWFAPVSDYQPKDLTEEEKQILLNPPMPWQFGLTTQLVSPILERALPMEEGIKVPAVQRNLDAKVLVALADYVKRKDEYETTSKKLEALYWDQDEGYDFTDFFFLPGKSMAYVQKHSEGHYYVMGDLRSKAGNHISLHYSGMEKAYKMPILKNLGTWHLMSRGFIYA